MGWTFWAESRKELIKEVTKKAVHHKDMGSHVWAIHRLIESERPIIVCHLIDQQSSKFGGLWGAKSVDETMGPMHYDCPDGYILNTYTHGGYSAQWREKCLTEE